MNNSPFNTLLTNCYNSLKIDETIHPLLAVSRGTLDNWCIASLHDVIRFHCKRIERAKKRVFIATSLWEGSSLSANMLTQSLKKLVKSSLDPIEIRLLVDHANTENMFSKNYQRLMKKSELKKMGLSDISISVKSLHKPLVGTMHAKFVVIDDDLAILSSNNIQDRPNIELAVELRGPIVFGFVNIFDRLWDGSDKNAIAAEISTPTNAIVESPIMFANRKSSGNPFYRDKESTQNIAWITLMNEAVQHIFISSPTFNARDAISSVFAACCRDVNVYILLTKNFNDQKEALPLQGGTNLNVVAKLKKQLKKKGKDGYLHVHWYVGVHETGPRIGVHSHVKFLAIDNSISMFGNGNMDTQSWYHSTEVNIVVNDARITESLTNDILHAGRFEIFSPNKSLTDLNT